jgi:hypothetical protein
MNCFCIKQPTQKTHFKIYEKGDFSFIRDYELRFLLTYDYNNVINNMGEEAFRIDYSKRTSFESNIPKDENNNVWDTPPHHIWDTIRFNMSPAHTEESFKRNIQII